MIAGNPNPTDTWSDGQPRWEWRIFQPAPFPQDLLPETLSPLRSVESAETYLVCTGSSLNFKIRDGHLEVKHLLNRSGDGLEQWEAVFKSAFPMTPRRFQRLQSLECGFPQAPDSALETENDFIDAYRELEGIRLIPVLKSRSVFHTGSTLFDHVRLQIGRKDFYSLAVEDVDEKKVRGWVLSMEFDPSQNTNYPAGLSHFAQRELFS